METKKSVKKIVLACICLLVVIVIMYLLYNQFKPDTVKGSKNIVAEVILSDGTSKSYNISTDEEYLRKALEQIDLISGSESEYGLFVSTVDGITVDNDKQEWWCFTLDGGELSTSVDSTPIIDGNHFEITLTTGW